VTELDGFAARGIDGTSVVGESTSPYTALLWQMPNSTITLHPAGAMRSYAYDTHNGAQVGEVVWTSLPRAALWSGTELSYIDLHPAGATRSVANAVHGSIQGGFSVIGGVQRAGIWSGSPTSWIDLHPAGALSSLVEDVFGNTQVGVARVGGIFRASMWSGSSASWLSMHPANASESLAYGIDANSQVGFATFNSDHAALWKGSAASFVDLHPAGATASIAYGVWGATQAGFAIVEGMDHAGYWVSKASAFTDSHQFLGPRFEESWAYDIWKDASIGVTYVAGRAYDGVDSVAIVWSRDPDEIAPHKLVLGTGTISAGSVSSVSESDDNNLEVLPGVVFTTSTPPVLLDFIGQATASTATHLSIFVESSASSVTVLQKIQAFDYVANLWITLHEAPSSVIDHQLRFDREDAARFISQSGEMRLRTSYRLTGPVLAYPWRAKLDWVRWRVMP
jgi:hypothetical protein